MSSKDVNLGSFGGQVFAIAGGELYAPADQKGYMHPDPARLMMPVLTFPGPCVLIYMRGPDAERFLAMIQLQNQGVKEAMRAIGGPD